MSSDESSPSKAVPCATTSSLGNLSAEKHFARAVIRGLSVQDKPWYFKMSRKLMLEVELKQQTAVWKKVNILSIFY